MNTSTQPQTTRQAWIQREAESIAQMLYKRPLSELTEDRQALLLRTATRKYRDYDLDPQPGFCFQCGEKLIKPNGYECRKCHEGLEAPKTLRQKEVWL